MLAAREHCCVICVHWKLLCFVTRTCTNYETASNGNLPKPTVPGRKFIIIIFSARQHKGYNVVSIAKYDCSDGHTSELLLLLLLLFFFFFFFFFFFCFFFFLLL